MMFEGLLVLEINSRTHDKNGQPLKNKQGQEVQYNTLICYERGAKYPELLKLNVASDKLSAAAGLVGRAANVMADVVMFKDGMSLYFDEGNAIKSANAA